MSDVVVATVRERTSRASQAITLAAVLVPPLGLLSAAGLLWGVAFSWVDAVVSRLRQNDIAGGFCAGIERCGVLLAHVSPASPGDNPDELSNRLLQEP